MNNKIKKQNTKDFDSWNIQKKSVDTRVVRLNFSERDVWFIEMGINVGFEQDGKGEEYLRPVLILKKFNKTIFLGIPLTKKKRDNSVPFYYSFQFKERNSTAILSQVRLYDAKRLKFRYGKISQHDFSGVKKKLTELIQ